ncbi:hypothetical protein [Wolbachia endosymbiont of Pentidionis agamae]
MYNSTLQVATGCNDNQVSSSLPTIASNVASSLIQVSIDQPLDKRPMVL